MSSLTSKVFPCPSCGAPLPAADDGQPVTCAFCGTTTTLDRDDALRREQASRAEAELLYATLGKPPSWTQRMAARLVGKTAWYVGTAFVAWASVQLGRPVRDGIKAWWETNQHERLLHVMSPSASWAFELGLPVVLLTGLLVWSLFGERVDARRELQAALAAHPPKTPGGPSACRHCGAPLAYAAGALGARCEACGADNLLVLPPAWLAAARKLDVSLRVGMRAARERRAEGRRRIRKAIKTRVPLVLVILAVISLPAYQRRNNAGWAEYAIGDRPRTALYRKLIAQPPALPGAELRALVRCEDADAIRVLAPKSELSTAGSGWCDATGCTAAGMFALAHGEELRLTSRAAGDLQLRLALAFRDYLGGTGVMADWYGDEVARVSLEGVAPDATVLTVPIAISGWYKLSLRGAEGVAVLPCVANSRRPAGADAR